MENLTIAGYAVDPSFLYTLTSAIVVLLLWESYLLGRREGWKEGLGQGYIERRLEEAHSQRKEAIHGWFELSYAQYLGLPRSILQNMPERWQNRFVALMDELDAMFDWRRPGMWVRFQNEHGRYMKDELADYDRGRRHLTPEEVHEISERARKNHYGR